ncbi:MAG: protease complex subunit PrcB family protein [Candidatus Eisenbacteria bacterium]
MRTLPSFGKISGLFLFFAPALLLSGCGSERATAPDRTWEEVRFHWSQSAGEEAFGDLVVDPSGTMEWWLQGERVSSRGLLAGENLETLTRLIDALPPAGYQGFSSCDRRFFVSVRVDGKVLDYSTGTCDSGAPEALRELSSRFGIWADGGEGHRRDPILHRLLAQGQHSDVASAGMMVATDRDELLRMLDQLGNDKPVLVPAIDFRREVAVGLFLGDCATSGYETEVTGVYRTDGPLLIEQRILVPGERCAVGTARTRPFVIVVIEGGAADDLLVDAQTESRSCGTEDPAK